MKDVAAISELLKPFDARLMRCCPVSTRIDHVGNDDAECSVPVELAEVQDRLFSWRECDVIRRNPRGGNGTD
jgi:hypothetical protein